MKYIDTWSNIKLIFNIDDKVILKAYTPSSQMADTREKTGA